MKYIALIIGKIVALLLKILGKNAGSFPGKVAISIYPKLLAQFKMPKITVLVTGTNGKTSTCNLISQSFKKAGYKTIANSRGDNLKAGISSLLIKHSKLNFSINSDVAVIEIDELTLSKNLNQINATDIIITNFFRDQLDRAGEMESVILKIEKSLQNYTNNLYLNADDPNVKRFFYNCPKANKIIWGMDKLKIASDTNSEPKEGKFCPLCKTEISYEYYQYSHIGKYKCSNCEFKNGNLDFKLHNINPNENSFEIQYKNQNTKLHYNIKASYHLYNLLSASSVLLKNNISPNFIDNTFKNFNLGIGRMETITIKDTKILLNLVKNPTGCNEIIKYIENNTNPKSLIFLLNDNHQDGRDTSWIWDVQFENIKNLKTVIATGKRANELGIRFKLAQISDNLIIEKDVNKAIDILLAQDGDKYIISTYTGLFSTRQLLINKSKQTK